MENKKILKEKYKDEKVFVISSNDMQNNKNKFTPKKDSDIWNKYNNMGLYIYRYDAEYNKAFQQIIPYFLIINENEDKYYVSERLEGDTRLKGKLSLGFGGHINECDGHQNQILNALFREMHEELNIKPINNFKYLGTIRDLTSETSEHFGLVFYTKAIEGEVSIKEVDNLRGKWMTKTDLFENYPRFENWSKFIIDHIYDNL